MSAHSKLCTHIKVTGVQCGSPALRGEQFCYFHQRMIRGVETPRNARLHPVALIEDEESIQSSLMEVINALCRNTIDLRRADLILKALYIAVKNSRRVRFAAGQDMVAEAPTFPAPEPVRTPAILGVVAEESPRVIEAAIDPTKPKPPKSIGESAPVRQQKNRAYAK